MEPRPTREPRWSETLIFEVSGRRFGLAASDVQELVRMVTMTTPPTGAGLVEGVINLRGTVVPVFDLRARLGMPPKPVEPSESLVIAHREGRPVAFRVDRALELATLYAGDIATARVVDREGESPSLMAKVSEGLVVLLDLKTLFDPIEPWPAEVDRP